MRIRSLPCLLFLAALLLPALAGAQPSDRVRSAPLAAAPAPLAKTAPVAEPPARLAAAVEPLARLASAERGAADQLATLAAHNRSGRPPVRIGFARPLPLERRVRFTEELAAAPAGLHAGGAFARVGAASIVWGAAVEVAEAHRLRLHLSGVELPAGTRMWVYGEDGAAVAFGPELAHEGGLWTPSVYGPSIRLEVELPREALGAAGHGFTLDQVGEIFRLGPDGEPIVGAVVPRAEDFSCLTDSNCIGPATFPEINFAEKAIAYIEFFEGGFGACSGGLLTLADGAPAGLDPPFLTANHCFSTQGGAASLEAFWDHRTTICNGAPPNLNSLPRSSGATLLASNLESDFTLVDFLSDPPGDRVLLGWNAENPTLPSGTQVHRLSHPFVGLDPHPLQYTRYQAKDEGDSLVKCGTTPAGHQTNDLTKFHHLVFTQGGSWLGSSGAPSMLGNGQVVGQLFAACGAEEDTDSACSTAYDELDGNFFTTFDFIASFLGVISEDGWLTTPAVPGFEFQVEITPPGLAPITGRMEPDCIIETFCASGALAGRPEVFVKIIGPRPNGFLWVQISRFTPSQVKVMVRQVSTGKVNTYVLPGVPASEDDVSGLQDRGAFSP
jgi:lysyl endopeptidase